MFNSDFDLSTVLIAIAFLNFGLFFFFSKKDLVFEKIPSAPITKSTRSFVLSSNLIKIFSKFLLNKKNLTWMDLNSFFQLK